MKGAFCCALVLGLCAFGRAEEYRVFTDKQGRLSEARIIKVDPRTDKVTVERNDHRRVTVPSSTFSAADQEYIKEWFAAQAFLSNSRLRVAVEKKKGKAEGKSPTKRAKPPCHYEVSFDNRSGGSLAGIRVEYCMYVVTDFYDGRDDEVKVEHGAFNAFNLGNRKQKLMETKTVKPYRYYNEQIEYGVGYFSIEDDKSYNKTHEESLEGIRVRLYMKTKSGREFMREICEPGSAEGKFGWEAVQVAGTSGAPAGGSSSKYAANRKFSNFDGNGDGRITLKEWFAGKKRVNGSKFSKGYATNDFNKKDRNGDGYVVQSEFN